MASIWKHPQSKFYTACWNTPEGKRMKRSTKLADKATALELAKRLEAESHGSKARHPASEAAARKQMGAALRICRNHYRKTAPRHASLFILSAKTQMYQALSDCRQLDFYREQHGLDALYVDACTIFTTKGALAGIHCRARNEFNALMGGKTPTYQAMQDGCLEEIEVKRLLEGLRESIRDGWDEAGALKNHAERIAKMASDGNADFFIALRDLLRSNRQKPYQRSRIAWIIRAWLPLCLWECEPDGQNAFARMAAAADLMGMGAAFYGSDKDTYFLKSFLPAWRNVRAKKLKL